MYRNLLNQITYLIVNGSLEDIWIEILFSLNWLSFDLSCSFLFLLFLHGNHTSLVESISNQVGGSSILCSNCNFINHTLLMSGIKVKLIKGILLSFGLWHCCNISFWIHLHSIVFVFECILRLIRKDDSGDYSSNSTIISNAFELILNALSWLILSFLRSWCFHHSHISSNTWSLANLWHVSVVKPSRMNIHWSRE